MRLVSRLSPFCSSLRALFVSLGHFFRDNLLYLGVIFLVSTGYVLAIDVGWLEFSGKAMWWKLVFSVVQVFLATLIVSRLRWTGSLLFAGATLVLVGLKYARSVFGYELNTGIVHAAFQTTWTEMSPYINLYSITFALLGLAVPLVYIQWLNRRMKVSHNWFVLVALIGVFSGLMQIPGRVLARNPERLQQMLPDEEVDNEFCRELIRTESSWIWKKRVRENFLSPGFKFDRIASYTRDYFKFGQLEDPAELPSTCKDEQEPLIFVLVIGESLRADHFSLFGYERETTPGLERQKNLYAFPEFYSSQTATAACIKGILSDATASSQKPTMNSFVTVLKKHGFGCSLITANYGAMNFFTSAMIQPIFTHYADSMTDCDYGNEKALAVFQKEMDAPGARKIIVFQNGMGHGPYNCEDQYKKFTPCEFSTTLNLKSQLTPMINAYDNTIVSVDDFLTKLMDKLKDRRAVVLFSSDHGESFGEKGRWGHCGPMSVMEQRHIPAFIWFSDKYMESEPEMVAAVDSHRLMPLGHDHIFHSVLSLCGIKSDAQKPELDFTDARVKPMPKPGREIVR